MNSEAQRARWRECTRRYQLAHPERFKELRKKYLATHKDLYRAAKVKWRACAANKEKERRRDREYKIANHATLLEKARRYTKSHPERAVRYRVAHPDRVKQALKKYQTAHPERYRASRAKWLALPANKEKLRRWSHEWRKAHPQANATHCATRRARKTNAAGSFTVAQWLALCWASAWRCFYCGTILNEKTAVREHQTPLCRGGSNDISNIVLSCALCNAHKGTRTDAEFRRVACGFPS